MSKDSMPLADLVVLDLTIARAGPTAVRQLADWGADVLRIDQRPTEAEAAEKPSPDALNLHRNKRSLIVDLKQDEGRRLLHRLVEGADVLVENMRPRLQPPLARRTRLRLADDLSHQSANRHGLDLGLWSRRTLRRARRCRSDRSGIGRHDERDRTAGSGACSRGCGDL